MQAAVRNSRWSLVAGRWRALHNRIAAAANKGMAAQDAGQGHQGAAKHAVTLDGLRCIVGTRGNVTTRRRQQRRDRRLVASQELERNEFGTVAHFADVVSSAVHCGTRSLLFASPMCFNQDLRPRLMNSGLMNSALGLGPLYRRRRFRVRPVPGLPVFVLRRTFSLLHLA